MDLSEQHKLSAPETAKYLGISTSTLSKLRAFAGGPPFLKFGCRVVYDPRDLNDRAAQRSRISFSDLGTAARGIRGTGTLGRHAGTGKAEEAGPNSPVIAPGLMSHDDTAGNDRFQRDNAKFSSRCAMTTAMRGIRCSCVSASATAVSDRHN